jgi:hypothetical protein
VLLRAQGEGVDVDSSIRGTCVVLERLDNIEVRTFTLRETILAVKLELSSDNRVLTPAVHIEGSLGKNECSGIRETRGRSARDLSGERCLKCSGGPCTRGGTESTSRGSDINSTGHLEKTSGGDEAVGTGSLGRSSEGVDGVREGINRVSVVERLGSECLEEDRVGRERGTVINVGIRLDNPDELLNRVVEVELDLVGRRSNRLVTSELDLLNEILVRVLGHLAALISVEEDVVDVEGSGNKRLLVGSADRLCSRCGNKGSDSPETLAERADVKVDLDLVILESNQRKSKTRVAAKPELKRNIECCLRKSLARSAHLGRGTRSSARASNVGEGRIGDVGKLGGVSNQLEVPALLLRGLCELVPDVEPVTVLAINALTSNLNLNLSNELLTDVIEPTSIDSVRCVHALVDLRKSDLEVCAVSKITISGDCACNTATKVSLARESLLDRLHGKVGVASVGHLPESNLGASSKENVLCAIGD